MLDIPKIYDDPIIFRRRDGGVFFPFRKIKESVLVQNSGYALLTEVPNRMDRVKVTGQKTNFYETDNKFLEEDWFKVDYVNGWVWFHEKWAGKTLNFEYSGTGVYLFPDSRVYHTGDGSFPTVKDKFEDVDRGLLEQKNRVDEQIRSVPQPSEVVDMRIDHNGKIFKVAKDRIDSEQKKIEEAYFDAYGKKHDSLKIRIDSLQLASDEKFDDINDELVKLDSQIKVIPGQINLKVSELRESVDGDLEKLQSEINMVPTQIKAEVSSLKQTVDGELEVMRSVLDMQADKLEMKVEVGNIVSSINLSKEGVRISGKTLWLDGNTKIDNAVIKSAHIDQIDASKIKTGTLNAIDIYGSNITGGIIRGSTIYIGENKPEFIFSNAIDANPESRGVHVYIRPKVGAEVRTTETGTLDKYVGIRTLAVRFPTGRNAYIGTDGELRVMSQGLAGVGVYRDIRANVFRGVAIDLNSSAEARNMYVRPAPDGEVRITRRGTTDRYRPIVASEFKIRSSATSKENIKPVKENGLSIIRKLNVVNFNYLDETETKIGVIAEESPNITSNDNEFVNMSELVMYLVLSMQEMDKEIQKLKK